MGKVEHCVTIHSGVTSSNSERDVGTGIRDRERDAGTGTREGVVIKIKFVCNKSLYGNL